MATRNVYFEGLGEVPVTDEEMAQYTPDEFRRKLVQEFAQYAEENDLDLDPFSRQFGKEFSGTARGIYELATDERSTTGTDDFFAEVALEKDPVRAWTGLITGALADPVTAPFAIVKLLKIGRLGQAAAAGGIGGGLQPVREEYGEDRLTNIGFGAAAGGVVGGAIELVMRKYGARSADELQDIYNNADDAGKAEMERDFEQMSFKFEDDVEAQVKPDEQVAADAARVEADAARTRQDNPLVAEAEAQRFRLETEDYNAKVKATVDELQADVATLPKRGEIKKFEEAVGEHTSYIKKLQDRIDNLNAKIDETELSNITPKAKRNKIRVIKAERDKVAQERDSRQMLLDQREGRLLGDINNLQETRRQLENYYRTGEVPEVVINRIGKAPEPPASVRQAQTPRPVQQDMFGGEVVDDLTPSTLPISRPAQPEPTVPVAPQAPVSPSQPRSAQPSATPQARADAAPTSTPAVPEQGVVARTVDAAIGSISARIEKFAPSIMSALRNFERRVLEKQANYINPTEPFFKAVDQLSPEMRRALKGHLYNGRLDEAMRLMNPTMRKQFIAIRSDLKKVHAELKAAGIDVARIDDYFPRKVADVRGLRDKLNREHKDKFTKAIDDATKKNGNKPLSPEQEEEVLNKVVRDVYRPKDPTRRGNTAARTLGELPDELLDFYHEPSMALTSYYRNMVDMAEKAKFFGRNMKVTDENTIDAVESIGNVIRDARMMRNLTPQQVEDLTRMLTARFVTGEQAPNAVLRWTRDTGYMGTIGNMVSAITNLGDLGTSGALHGFAETIAAAFGKNKYDVVKMGIDHSISHELMDNKATAKALQKVFTWSGFRFTDRLGKNTLMNAAMSKNEKLAKTGAGKAALRKRWEKYFGDEMDSLLVDLEKGNVTENTKLLAFHELSNVQPITLSEMPQYYLEHPDGRIVYMLKSFTLKQLDLVRRHIVGEAKQGNYFQASKNMALLAGYLAAANTGTQVVKDFILGRDIDPDQLPEQAMWNVFSVFGVNKYIADRYLSQGDVMGAVSNTLLPPVPVLEMARKGIKETQDMLEGEEYNYAKLTRELPVVGSLIYSHFGGGKENYNDRLAKAGEE